MHMETLVALGAKYLIWVAVAAFVLVFALTAQKRRFLWLAVTALPLTYVLGKVAGALWYDPRPFVAGDFTPLVAHAADNGFPSDHMLLASAMASVVFVFNRRAGVALWVLALIIGAARVLAGVHHVVDIAASALIAIASVWVAHFFIKRFV